MRDLGAGAIPANLFQDTGGPLRVRKKRNQKGNWASTSFVKTFT